MGARGSARCNPRGAKGASLQPARKSRRSRTSAIGGSGALRVPPTRERSCRPAPLRRRPGLDEGREGGQRDQEQVCKQRSLPPPPPLHSCKSQRYSVSTDSPKWTLNNETDAALLPPLDTTCKVVTPGRFPPGPRELWPQPGPGGCWDPPLGQSEIDLAANWPQCFLSPFSRSLSLPSPFS